MTVSEQLTLLINNIKTNNGLNCNPKWQCTDPLTIDLLLITNILQQMIDTSNTWYSEYQERFSSAGVLSSLYQDRLLGDSLNTNGSFATFSYTFTWANNSNTKTVYIKFANQVLETINIPVNTSNTIIVNGSIKCTSFRYAQAQYQGQYVYNGSVTQFNGNLSNVNFGNDNFLILQALGVAYSDITSIGGQGNLFPTTSNLF